MRPRRGASPLSTSPSQDGLFPDNGGGPVRDGARPFATTAGFELAETDPVAEVRLIGVLPHLDRPFEYAVTTETAAAAPGMRVKVRFSGQETDGIVLARRARPTTDRPLAPLRRLPSRDVVISPALLRVCADVAERCAGTVGDVLRLALPPRHARAEKADRAAREKKREAAKQAADGLEDPDGAAHDPAEPDPAGRQDAGAGEPGPLPDPITRYRGLAALIQRAGSQGPVPRAAAVLDPVDPWCEVAARAVAALAPGRGALVIAPDARDVARLGECLRARGIDHEALGSADGPEKRYRAFLRILRGESRVVIGTRSAAFAPVQDLALTILWDSADDLLEEPRAPYPHTVTVLQCRSREEGCALLLLSAACSPLQRHLADLGYLRLLEPEPAPLLGVRPRIRAMDDYLRERDGGSGHARVPGEAMRVIREGITHGPVLVQVPRSGYVPAIACDFCGTRCRCPTCAAPLSLEGRSGPLVCRVCGRREDGYRCPECDRTGVRAVVIGSTRTAEELRRAFPHAPFRVAGGAHGPVADDDVPDGAIVIATPGAEPAPADGYSAGVLLDADAMLARAAYDADTEAVRRWANAIALVRTGERGGEVLVVGTATLPAIRDLVAHRSSVLLERVLADRTALRLPPMAKIAEVSGDRDACRDLLASLEAPAGTEVLGPTEVPREDGAIEARAVVRVEPVQARALLRALRAAVASRTARKAPGRVRVRVDPPDVF